ncbi:MAG: hypothetical protein COX06_02515 [Candidatus Zambryskibacteria bacterium CG22_combo_CG10-13_8_21_14_all_42_17]|uniref:Uncharacterized protein n=1 Tax=Candidatus Zambryskibacteria bacterium CG22_combo_CG10-13_8_21_14_all_42_17 TaxID=1975118 RepID=A0A2H0BD16_9BACT|nr:MAG: hypothetical protein COX06_02515 [Candidatus Zambryskibacteria bacterium CG22_combo_CG10-13_8_21_14_all_42_17]
MIKVVSESACGEATEGEVKEPECNLRDPHSHIGSRAIAGALARMSRTSNDSQGFQCALSPASWQQWGDWDNGHADS